MSTAAVKFESVKKTYKSRQGRIEALKGLDLVIPEGQIFGFAGPNGAGKSTSIKILVGLIRPDEGAVTVFGHPSGSKAAKSLIGFLPEVTLYHEFMSAKELLAIHATLSGIPANEIAGKCEEALEKVGLSDRVNYRLKEFSKGMKQRFGIAQAIVGNPKLLVLDELTSGLDPKAQAELLTLLTELKAQGLTIFFSSHHLREIEKICDSVAIIHQGTLRTSGTLDEVLGEDVTVSLKVMTKDGQEPKGELAQWRRDSDGGFLTVIKKSETLALIQSLEGQVERIHNLETRRQSLEEIFHRMTPKEEAEKS